MAVFTFPEMVANEKGWEPLLVDKASNRIRRDLFRGLTVGIDGFEGKHYGGTHSLPNQVCAQMIEWGFKFDRPKSKDSNRTGFKLINRDHVPTVRVKPDRTRRPPKRADLQQPLDGQPPTKDRRGALTAALREALLEGQPFSSQDCVTQFGGTGGNLRRVVNSMKSEGYQFDEYQGETGKTWLIKGGGPRRGGGSKSKAVVKANGHAMNGHLPILAGMEAASSSSFEIPPLPEFGSTIRMVGNLLRPDGSIALIFRNDEEETWVTTMEGHSVGD